MKLPYVNNLLVAAITFHLSNKWQHSFTMIGIFKNKKQNRPYGDGYKPTSKVLFVLPNFSNIILTSFLSHGHCFIHHQSDIIYHYIAHINNICQHLKWHKRDRSARHMISHFLFVLMRTLMLLYNAFKNCIVFVIGVFIRHALNMLYQYMV